MSGSPVDAISKAVERSKQLLFPFKADKWFALGFTVFMAQCGEGGGASSFNLPSLPSGSPSTGSGSGSPGTELQDMINEAMRALHANLALYALLAAGALLLAFGLWLFVAWFSSRAKLMFVESVVWDRVDVSGQWTRAGELGMSLFKCRVVLALCVWLLGLGAVAGGALVGLPDFQAGDFLGSRALVAYAIFVGSFLVVGLPIGVALALLDDFVVPLMVVRNVRVMEAWRMCRAEVLTGNVGGVVVFYLLRFALGIGIGIAIVAVTCLTCCITAIPYIGTVVLLPVWVFSRAFPLYYLEQVGIPIFPQPEPSWAAYDQWRFPR